MRVIYKRIDLLLKFRIEGNFFFSFCWKSLEFIEVQKLFVPNNIALLLKDNILIVGIDMPYKLTDLFRVDNEIVKIWKMLMNDLQDLKSFIVIGLSESRDVVKR